MVGLPIVRIIRIRIKNLHLGNSKPGEWRHLTEEEVAALKR
jgi:23S rRNA pseudouridine2605 synthase